MQIDIDFEVFKALTALRESEADSYNAVIRRLLNLPHQQTLASLLDTVVAGNANSALASASQSRKGIFGSAGKPSALSDYSSLAELVEKYQGVWFGNVLFPEGTKFRATYKGKTYQAEIKGGQWVGDDGITRTSPSDAASAISHTNVNGWRFWHVQLPGDPSWRKLEELRP